MGQFSVIAGGQFSVVFSKHSGARTLLINPHYTVPNGKWDYYIPQLKSLKQILPYVGLEQKKVITTTKSLKNDNEALSLLINENAINLDNYTVVGGYRRYNTTIRANLISLCERIKGSFLRKEQGRQNYLIAAAPGSGKTYLIEELAKSMEDKIHFVSIDLSEDSEETIKSKLAEIKRVRKDCLCMIDEVDGRSGEDWPYDTIYKYLDLNESPTTQNVTVFVLIGSSGGTCANLRKVIASRYKGNDMNDRISDTPEFRTEIPPLEIGDGLCVYCSKILEVSDHMGKKLSIVEKLAAYYAIMTKLHSPRQIKMLVENAIGRAIETSSILKYDHHFDAGTPENKEFWSQNTKVVEKLTSSIIKISLK